MEKNKIHLYSTLFALIIIVCVIGLIVSDHLELVFVPALLIVIAGILQKKYKDRL